MQPNEQDAACLWDMLDAAEAAVRFVEGRERNEYLQDDLLQAAVERKIEIIGEAAGHVSEEFRQANPQIPWAKIRGQRHVLAHDYGRIEHDRIWSVVTVHLPDLISQIRPLLPTEGSGFDA